MNFFSFFKNVFLAILLSFFALFLITVISLNIVKEIDLKAAETQSQFINAIIEHEAKRLAEMTYDYTVWDEAVEKFSGGGVGNFDEKWLRQNVDESIISTFKISEAIVLNEKNEKIFLSPETGVNEKINTSDLKKDYSVLDFIINETRAKPTSNPEVSYSKINIDNKTYMAFASALTYQEKRESLNRNKKQQNVLLLLRSIDEEFLNDMQGSFKHKFAKKPEVIDGNMKALQLALNQVNLIS